MPFQNGNKLGPSPKRKKVYILISQKTYMLIYYKHLSRCLFYLRLILKNDTCIAYVKIPIEKNLINNPEMYIII